jgi:hypothetical protein
MTETNYYLAGRTKPLTDRQRVAQDKRQKRLDKMDLNAKTKHSYFPCIGCCSGIRPWNLGSDYCSRCLSYRR